MKRFWLFLTIVFLSQAVCFAGGEKPKKITKLIYFEGSIEKKKPIGHGKLILDRYRQDEDADYYIVGNFSDDKITNAEFYINGRVYKETITGDFGFAINEKESTVTLTLNNVTFNGLDKLHNRYNLEHISLGTVVIGNNNDSDWKGMGFIQDYIYNIRRDLPFDKYPEGLKPLIGSSQCTREALVKIKCKKGIGFFDIEEVQFESSNYMFKNGAIYKPTDDESGVYEISGSDVLQVRFENVYHVDCPVLMKNSIIQLKDKSTLKIINWEVQNTVFNTTRGDILVDGEITFTEGSNYNGTLLLSQLTVSNYGWGMTIYNYFKNVASKDLNLFNGKLVSSQGKVTEYYQGNIYSRDEFKAANIDFSIFGIPIGGDIATFKARLRSKGCHDEGKEKYCNIHHLYGRLFGKEASIAVYYDDVSGLVYKVTVKIREVSDEDQKSIIETVNKKYGVARKKSNKVMSSSIDYWYSNEKYSLYLWNGSYTELTYYNKDNWDKKIETDFTFPSLNLSKTDFLKACRSRGRNIIKDDNLYCYYIDVAGIMRCVTIKSYSDGAIEEVCVKFDGDDKEAIEDNLRDKIEFVYPNATKDEKGRYLVNGMIIEIERSGQVYLLYKKQRKTRDIDDI